MMIQTHRKGENRAVELHGVSCHPATITISLFRPKMFTPAHLSNTKVTFTPVTLLVLVPFSIAAERHGLAKTQLPTFELFGRNP